MHLFLPLRSNTCNDPSLYIIGLQRQLSYMNPDGGFKMFREDGVNMSSVW